MPDSADPTSIPQLVRRLFDDGDRLVRAEFRLATAEAGGAAKAALPGLVAVMIGGLFLLVSVFTLCAAIIGWLTPRLGAGMAALVVTLAAAGIGGALVAIGASRLKNISLASKRSRSATAQSGEPNR